MAAIAHHAGAREEGRHCYAVPRDRGSYGSRRSAAGAWRAQRESALRSWSDSYSPGRRRRGAADPVNDRDPRNPSRAIPPAPAESSWRCLVHPRLRESAQRCALCYRPDHQRSQTPTTARRPAPGGRRAPPRVRKLCSDRDRALLLDLVVDPDLEPDLEPDLARARDQPAALGFDRWRRRLRTDPGLRARSGHSVDLCAGSARSHPVACS